MEIQISSAKQLWLISIIPGTLYFRECCWRKKSCQGGFATKAWFEKGWSSSGRNNYSLDTSKGNPSHQACNLAHLRARWAGSFLSDFLFLKFFLIVDYLSAHRTAFQQYLSLPAISQSLKCNASSKCFGSVDWFRYTKTITCLLNSGTELHGEKPLNACHFFALNGSYSFAEYCLVIGLLTVENVANFLFGSVDSFNVGHDLNTWPITYLKKKKLQVL